MLLRLLIFSGLIALLSPAGLTGQSLAPPSPWDRLVGQALDSVLYTVEVEYVLIEIATGDRFVQDDWNYFNRIPLVGVAADSMIWTAAELARAPWQIDPDFEDIIGRERFRPEVSAVTIIDGSGRRIAPDTTLLPADSSATAIAYVIAEPVSGLPTLEGPLPEKLLFVTLSPRRNAFSYDASWETVSPGRRVARRPEVDRFDERDVSLPTLLVGVHPAPGSLHLAVLGWLLPNGQLSDPYVLIPLTVEPQPVETTVADTIPQGRILPVASEPLPGGETTLPGGETESPSDAADLPDSEAVRPTLLPGAEVHEKGKKKRRRKQKKKKEGGSGSRTESILPTTPNSSV